MRNYLVGFRTYDVEIRMSQEEWGTMVPGIAAIASDRYVPYYYYNSLPLFFGE